MKMSIARAARVLGCAALTCCSFASAQTAAPAPQGRDSQSLEAIRAVAARHVRVQLTDRGDDAIVTPSALDPRLRLPACAGELTPSQAPGVAPSARTTVAVVCRDPVWTVYVPVTVETRQQVLVLRAPAARGATLVAADVEPQTRRVLGTGSDFVTDVAGLSGRHLRRPVPAGTALTADLFERDLLVKRGQDVTLIAAIGGIEVRAPGRALADAAAHARVRVQNRSSLKVVEGLVDEMGVVRVTP